MEIKLRRKDLQVALGDILKKFDARISKLESNAKAKPKGVMKKKKRGKGKKAIALITAGLFLLSSSAQAKMLNRGVDPDAAIAQSKIDITTDPSNSDYDNSNKYLQLPTEATPPAAASANAGGLYYDTDDNSVYKSTGSAWEVAQGDNTLDNAYDQGGAGAGSKIDADSGVVEIEVDDTSNNGALLLDMDDSTNNPNVLTITNAGTGNDITAPNFTLLNGAISATSLSVTTLYQSAIVAASSGNQNLTIDGAGNGTITLANTSTGKIVADSNTEFNDDVDIGDAATDTLSITSIIDSNVTLDDGTGASPSIILTDATDETGTFAKADGSHTTFTPNAAGQAFQVLTGNLRVGNGTPGTASMDGEDAYVEGELEVDGAVQIDGAITLAGTVSSDISQEVSDTGAEGAELEMFQNSASPAVNDAVGIIDFYGEDDGDNKTEYGEIRTLIGSATGGSEAGLGQWFLQNGTGSLPTLPQVQINGSTAAVSVNREADGSTGSTVQLVQDSASPAADDEVGYVKFIGDDDGGNTQEYAQMKGVIEAVADGSEQGSLALLAANASGTVTQVASITNDGTNSILSVGDDSATGIVESEGDYDLQLQTGNSTTGTVTITDGANGDVTLDPNGSGDVVCQGAATSADTVQSYVQNVIRYAWENSDPDGNDDISITIPYKCEIVDVWAQVSTVEGGAMTATLRDAANGGGNAISSAIDCNDTSLERSTALTNNAIAASTTVYMNFSGDPGTAVGVFYIETIRVE